VRLKRERQQKKEADAAAKRQQKMIERKRKSIRVPNAYQGPPVAKSFHFPSRQKSIYSAPIDEKRESHTSDKNPLANDSNHLELSLSKKGSSDPSYLQVEQDQNNNSATTASIGSATSSTLASNGSNTEVTINLDEPKNDDPSTPITLSTDKPKLVFNLSRTMITVPEQDDRQARLQTMAALRNKRKEAEIQDIEAALSVLDSLTAEDELLSSPLVSRKQTAIDDDTNSLDDHDADLDYNNNVIIPLQITRMSRAKSNIRYSVNMDIGDSNTESSRQHEPISEHDTDISTITVVTNVSEVDSTHQPVNDSESDKPHTVESPQVDDESARRSRLTSIAEMRQRKKQADEQNLIDALAIIDNLEDS
jgi:hypothetical protein